MTLTTQTYDSDERKDREDVAYPAFEEYFVKNYPGPNTIISDPKWHAPKIFRAAQYAIEQAALAAAPTPPHVEQPAATLADGHKELNAILVKEIPLMRAEVSAIGAVEGCGGARDVLLKRIDRICRVWWGNDANGNQRTAEDAPHVEQHSHKHVPSVERVRSTHTQMSTAAFLEKSPHGHRTYTQGQDESCYLCALLAEIDVLRAKLAHVEQAREPKEGV